jgi:hypothetical protein
MVMLRSETLNGTRVPSKWALLGHPLIQSSQGMQTITTIGLDIAKSVFRVRGVDAGGNIVVLRQLKRRCVLAFVSEVAIMPGWHRWPVHHRIIGRVNTNNCRGQAVHCGKSILSACGPSLPTWAVQQVVSFLGHTGRAANITAMAESDPDQTSTSSRP